MPKPRAQAEHDDEDLRGTFVFVLFIAAVMAAIWITVFLLFLSRY
jgi:hypothetical protein